MTLYLYSLRNRLSGIYERPVAEIYDQKQYHEFLTQSLALAELDVLNRYKEFDVYCLGILDSKSGAIEPNCEFLFTLEDICTVYSTYKEKMVNEDVGKSEVN